MAEFAAPSFSLGLDSDQEESQSRQERAVASPIDVSSQSPKADDDEDDGDFNSETLDPDPAPALKRLRRGPPPPLSSIRERESPKQPSTADDEIEEFSSQEDAQQEEHFYTQNRSACSSSKFSLRQRVLTTQSAKTSNARKKKPTESASTSASLEASSSKFIFPRLTISPLRKFQLLDSDSDEPVSEVKRKNANTADTYAKDRQFVSQKSLAGTQNKKTKCSSSVLQTESAWKDFSPVKNNKMETPALDEFCEEFFRSMKDGNASNSVGGDMRASCSNTFDEDCLLEQMGVCFPHGNNWESEKKSRKQHDSCLPAYQYFYHNDPKIRKLVQDRLPNFFPIGTVNQGGQFDYMSQFGQTDASMKASAQPHGTGNKGLQGSSRKSKRNLNNASAQEVSQASGSWMNPKSSATIPRDAGKRRIRADLCSAGHWYTAPDGKKVYVSKNGQELAGQMAYRQYRKENGRGFKTSRKKAPSKKRSKKRGRQVHP